MVLGAAAAEAFCPAHITGFFKAHAGGPDVLRMGSTGAGFSLASVGVTTRVVKKKKKGGDGRAPYTISTEWCPPVRTDVSAAVVEGFLDAAGEDALSGASLDITHSVSVPVGYGLGSSAAAALSLAYALDEVLGTGMSGEEIGGMAHAAEIGCRTGLGDVLAAYYGGFEIRTAPGAPGVGTVERVEVPEDVVVMAICLEPVSTSRFISERLSSINGLGGSMIEELRRSKDYAHFQDMSLQFADHIGVVTPRMKGVTRGLGRARVGCGVALFGQTVFCMVRAGSGQERRARDVFDEYLWGSERQRPGAAAPAVMIRSGLDRDGARLLRG